MSDRLIYVPNTCRDLVVDATAQKWCDAIQRQIALDVAPEWNQSAIVHYVGDSQLEKPRSTDGVVPIVRKSSYDGTLGSHWLDHEGPRGEVGAQTCVEDNVPIESCLSHELIELVGDALAVLCYQVGSEIWAAELCDRVEGSDPDYKIDGVAVENFSTRAAFTDDPSGPWDFRRKCVSNVVMPGGYQLRFNLRTMTWEQVTGARVRASKKLAAPSARRATRIRRAGYEPRSMVVVAA